MQAWLKFVIIYTYLSVKSSTLSELILKTSRYLFKLFFKRHTRIRSIDNIGYCDHTRLFVSYSLTVLFTIRILLYYRSNNVTSVWGNVRTRASARFRRDPDRFGSPTQLKTPVVRWRDSAAPTAPHAAASQRSWIAFDTVLPDRISQQDEFITENTYEHAVASTPAELASSNSCELTASLVSVHTYTVPPEHARRGNCDASSVPRRGVISIHSSR